MPMLGPIKALVESLARTAGLTTDESARLFTATNRIADLQPVTDEQVATFARNFIAAVLRQRDPTEQFSIQGNAPMPLSQRLLSNVELVAKNRGLTAFQTANVVAEAEFALTLGKTDKEILQAALATSLKLQAQNRKNSPAVITAATGTAFDASMPKTVSGTDQNLLVEPQRPKTIKQEMNIQGTVLDALIAFFMSFMDAAHPPEDPGKNQAATRATVETYKSIWPILRANAIKATKSLKGAQPPTGPIESSTIRPTLHVATKEQIQNEIADEVIATGAPFNTPEAVDAEVARREKEEQAALQQRLDKLNREWERLEAFRILVGSNQETVEKMTDAQLIELFNSVSVTALADEIAQNYKKQAQDNFNQYMAEIEFRTKNKVKGHNFISPHEKDMLAAWLKRGRTGLPTQDT